MLSSGRAVTDSDMTRVSQMTPCKGISHQARPWDLPQRPPRDWANDWRSPKLEPGGKRAFIAAEVAASSSFPSGRDNKAFVTSGVRSNPKASHPVRSVDTSTTAHSGQHWMSLRTWHLTSSLSGRLPPSKKRRERTINSRSRRNPVTSHGRSKRWLGASMVSPFASEVQMGRKVAPSFGLQGMTL
jgi:hypothetical protein